MENKTIVPNYYQILECARTATTDEIKKSYQRLALLLHPDKRQQDTSSDDELFLSVREAWETLRDPQARKLYDAEIACQEHSEVLLYEAISIKDMDFDSVEGFYSYTCRCGGTYLLKNCEQLPSKVTIGCDECSFSIEVLL